MVDGGHAEALFAVAVPDLGNDSDGWEKAHNSRKDRAGTSHAFYGVIWPPVDMDQGGACFPGAMIRL
jgi:hypothetical protein